MRILSTERLHLRRPDHDDAEFFLELLNDKSFIDNIADRGIRTVDAAKGYIDNLLKSFETKGIGYCVVTDTGEEKLGVCGILFRETLKDPDVGYAFLPRYCGKGYALEASRALMNHARTTLGLGRISAIVSPHNERSILLLKKLGLVYQGRIRHNGEADEVDLFLWEESVL